MSAATSWESKTMVASAIAVPGRAPTRLVIGVRTITIEARDGHPLAATIYEPAGCFPERVVIVAPATAARRSFYEPYARWLASQGCVAITFDYRGIGGSLNGDIAASKATLREWGEKDFAAVIDWAKQTYWRQKLGVVGHSIGGQLVGILDNATSIDTVVTVAAQNGFYRLYPIREAITYGLLWTVMPLIARVLGYFPAKRWKLGEDLPKGVALEWARFCKNAQYMIDERGAPLRAGFHAYEGHVLAYSFAGDLRAPKSCVESLHSFFEKARVEHRHIEGRVGHVGFFFAKHRGTLWKDSLEFLRGNR